MNYIVLVRHGFSEHNKINKYTGFINSKLTDEAVINTKKLGEKMKKKFNFNIAFTSTLDRTKDTCKNILSSFENNIEIISSDSLRGRDYGDLTDKYKDEILKKYGKDQVFKWTRGFKYKSPNGESLKDVYLRVKKYYYNFIFPYILCNKNILIVGHNNSLAALLLNLKIFNLEQIKHLTIPNGKPFIIYFKNGVVKKYKYNNNINIQGLEVLNFNGYPTIEIKIKDENKKCLGQSVVQTSDLHESKNIYDNSNRYSGKGLTKIINIIKDINDKLFLDNNRLINLKKSDNDLFIFNKSKNNKNININLINSISYALADTAKNIKNMELFEYFLEHYNLKSFKKPNLIVDMINLNNEFKISVIFNKNSYNYVLEQIHFIYKNLNKYLNKNNDYYIDNNNLYFIKNYDINDIFSKLLKVINKTKIYNFIFIGLTVNTKKIFKNDSYYINGKQLNNNQLLDFYFDIINNNPILKYIENPFFNNLIYLVKLKNKIPKNFLILSNNFKENEKSIINGYIIQISEYCTITKLINFIFEKIKNNNNTLIVQNSDNETNNDILIDLSISVSSNYIKLNPPFGHNVIKYNRLIKIENFILNSKR